MHVTFTPEDGERQEWDIVLGDIPTIPGELIEKRYGETFGQWMGGVQQGNAKARRVLLWYLQRLEHHTLRIEDMPDFRFKDLQIEYSVAELEEMRENVAKHPDAIAREKVLAQIEAAMPDALAREQAAGTGKARSKASAASGGMPSPAS